VQEKESTRSSEKEGPQARQAIGASEEVPPIAVTGFRGKHNVHLFLTRAQADAMAWQYLQPTSEATDKE